MWRGPGGGSRSVRRPEGTRPPGPLETRKRAAKAQQTTRGPGRPREAAGSAPALRPPPARPSPPRSRDVLGLCRPRPSLPGRRWGLGGGRAPTGAALPYTRRGAGSPRGRTPGALPAEADAGSGAGVRNEGTARKSPGDLLPSALRGNPVHPAGGEKKTKQKPRQTETGPGGGMGDGGGSGGSARRARTHAASRAPLLQ